MNVAYLEAYIPSRFLQGLFLVAHSFGKFHIHFKFPLAHFGQTYKLLCKFNWKIKASCKGLLETHSWKIDYNCNIFLLV